MSLVYRSPMLLQRTVWRGTIDGVEYRLVSCTPRSSLDTDRIVAGELERLASVTLLDHEPVDTDDGVARWRSEEEMGFAPRRRAQPKQAPSAIECDGDTSVVSGGVASQPADLHEWPVPWDPY